MSDRQIVHAKYRSSLDTLVIGSTSQTQSFFDWEYGARQLEQVHNSSLHGWGVAEGLSVIAIKDATKVYVSPGVAVDRSGCQISLSTQSMKFVSETTTISPQAAKDVVLGDTLDPFRASPVIEPAETTEFPGTYGLDCSTLANGSYYVTVQFGETEYTLPISKKGIITHTPWLRLISESDYAKEEATSVKVVLAKVQMDGGKIKELAATKRREVGLRAASLEFKHAQANTIASTTTISDTGATALQARDDGGLQVKTAASGSKIELAGPGGSFATLSVAAQSTELGGQAIVGGGLTVKSDAMLQGALTVAGKLTAQSDAEVQGSLTATGKITAKSDVEVQGLLTAAGKLTAQSDAEVQKKLTAKSDVDILGTATISGKLTAKTETEIQGTLRVTGNTDAVFARDVYWGGGSVLGSDQGGSIELGQGNPGVRATPFIDFHFHEAGAPPQDANVRIINDADGQLTVAASRLLVAQQLDVVGPLTARNNTTIGGALTVSGQLTANSRAVVQGPLTVGGQLRATADAAVQGPLTVGGQFTASSSASVNGALDVGTGIHAAGDEILVGVKNLSATLKERAAIQIDGSRAVMVLGVKSTASSSQGNLIVRDHNGQDSVNLRGEEGNILFRGALLDPAGRHSGVNHSQLSELISKSYTSLHRHLNSGNAASAKAVWLKVMSGGATFPKWDIKDVSLPRSTRVFAFIAFQGIDVFGTVDTDDTIFGDIYQVNGASYWAGGSVSGGNLGASGADTNMRSPIFSGTANKITFRLGTWANQTVTALGVVFPEES